MKLTITVTQSPTGWTLTYTSDDPALQLAQRELENRDGYPASNACVDVAKFFRRIVLGDVDADAPRCFGNYLTDVLLGTHANALWDAPKDEPIELRIAIAPADAVMQGLPWELMHHDDTPIAADAAPPIAIVRVIEATQVATVPLEMPLRVLFVVGRTLDADLRPGAEYMALLRRTGGGGDQGTPQLVRMNTRVLLQATTGEIERAIDEFRPAVVHFICHGGLEDGLATLQLTATEAEKKIERDHAVDAKSLLQMLQGTSGKAPLPSVVVLNACHSADAVLPETVNAYRSMAAQLVADGVPMAVGMAGEVADGACRIFTCAFYEALLEGKPVALASARGRRAALRRYSAYHDTVEWARPGLFVASHCQAMLPIAGATVDLTQIAGTFLKLKKPRAFCDRLKCLNEFEALLRRIAKQGGRYALGFGVDPRSDSTLQYGKTRLLEELAARLVLEGFAPVVVSGSTRSSDDPPDTLHGLAIRIGQAISTTRKNFGLPALDRTEALKFALAESGVEWDGEGGASLQIAVNAIRRKLADRKYEAAGIRALISRDLAKLIADLKDWGITHAALLIDDLDKFDGAALPLLDTLDQFGLGEPPHVIPLLFTYTRGSDKGIFLFMEQRVYPDVTLGPFLDPEDLLAHRQFLLTRPVEPVAVNAHRDKRKDVAEMYDEFRQLTSGVPSRWEASTFEQTVKVCRRFNLLLDADDEEILKSYG